MTGSGLGYAIQHLRQNSRGDDTELAHISPQEVQMFDAIQGRKIRNPRTGLPEYGLLGSILGALLGVGGFMIGGPAGAAAGSALGAGVQGGNLKQILTAGALGGVGGELGQGLTGGGWNPIGGSLGGSGAAGAGGLAQSAAEKAGALTTGGSGGIPAVTSMPVGLSPASAAAASMPATPAAGGLLSHIGGYGGLGAGLGAMAGTPMPTSPTPQMPQDNFRIGPVAPMQRNVTPYPGNPLTYGQTGGEWSFLNPSNPPAQYLAAGGVPHANLNNPLPLHRLRAMSRRGYSNMMAGGGSTHDGPVDGPGSGADDKIPAQLSDGEHVWSAKDVSALGSGSNAEGQRRLYRLRKLVNDQAGYKPSERLKAPRKMPSDKALIAKAMA